MSFFGEEKAKDMVWVDILPMSGSFSFSMSAELCRSWCDPASGEVLVDAAEGSTCFSRLGSGIWSRDSVDDCISDCTILRCQTIPFFQTTY